MSMPAATPAAVMILPVRTYRAGTYRTPNVVSR
jgi:hypothetical protein